MRSSLVILAACTAYGPDLPASPFFCGDTDPKCPDGYTCVTAGVAKPTCESGVPTMMGTCTMPFSGTVASWTFAGQPGDQTSTAVATTAPGATAGDISRAATLTPSPGTGSISASNWSTAAQLDPNSYFTLSVTPAAGCTLSLTGAMVDVKSSGTGPASAAIGTSADGFAQTAAVSTAMPSTPTLAVTDASAAVELRIFGFAAPAAGGTMRVENELDLTGSMQ